MKSVAQRNATAKAYLGKGGSYSGMCEKFTRTCMGFPAKYASARLAYLASKAAGGFHTGDYDAPAGVPVFWDILSGKNVRLDHVAYSVGNGYCISTSAGPGGTVALVKISDLTRRWGMRYLGWAEIYHGKRVFSKKESAPQTPPSKPTGGLTSQVKKSLKAMGLSQTIAGVKTYQRVHGLKSDGYWGPKTERYYQWVKRLQRYLNEWKAVKPDLVVDGYRGIKTKRGEQRARASATAKFKYLPPKEPAKR